MLEIQAPLATLLAGFVSGLLLLYVHRKNARRAAAVKYRGALLEAFVGLYPIASNWPENIDRHLKTVFPSLQRAVAEFRPYVPWHARRSFDLAWRTYRLGSDGRDIDKQLYHQYMGFTEPGQPVVDPKIVFQKNVRGLFAFAGET